MASELETFLRVWDEEAKKTYPSGWKAPKPYLRIVPQPK